MPIFMLKLDIWGQISEIAGWILLILGMMKDQHAPSMPIIFLILKNSRWPSYAVFVLKLDIFTYKSLGAVDRLPKFSVMLQWDNTLLPGSFWN